MDNESKNPENTIDSLQDKTEKPEYIEPMPTSKKRRRLARDAIVVFCTILGLVIATGVGGYFSINYLLGYMDREEISQDGKDLGIGSHEEESRSGSSFRTSSISSSSSNSSDPSDSSSDSASAFNEETASLATLPYYFDGIQGITNIALFGIDADAGTAGRSDTIMILTIDTNTNKIKLSSIVRDSYSTSHPLWNLLWELTIKNIYGIIT